MKTSWLKWGTAFSVSLLVHIGVASQFARDADEVLMEGGAPAQAAVLGSAFSDSIASGDPNETLEPIEPTEEKIEPVEPLTTEAEIEPSEAPTPEHEPIKPVEVVEVVPDTEVKPDITPPKENTVSQPAPVEPIPSQSEPLEIASLIPQTAIESETQHEVFEAPALEAVPVPVKREVIQPKPEPKQKTKPRKKKAKKKKKQTNKKVASGNKGKSKATTKAGSKDGKKTAKSKKEGKKNKLASRSGNASASNYPGKIVRKLRRALRYPKAAKKKRIRGEVMVSFVVSGAGKVSGVRIIRGSGSSILDEAAIKTVYRAAPFPKIPAGAGKTRWSFKVPLAFK